MKYCTKCGTQVQDDANVCLNCGCRIEDNTPARPAFQLKTNRGLLKYILLSIITFGIYGIVVMSTISTDINDIASKYDGKRTMHFCLVFLCSVMVDFWNLSSYLVSLHFRKNR